MENSIQLLLRLTVALLLLLLLRLLRIQTLALTLLGSAILIHWPVNLCLSEPDLNFFFLFFYNLSLSLMCLLVFFCWFVGLCDCLGYLWFPSLHFSSSLFLCFFFFFLSFLSLLVSVNQVKSIHSISFQSLFFESLSLSLTLPEVH
jgi:hypothetical protein